MLTETITSLTTSTILVVDDTPANLAVIVDSLEGFGLNVLIAQDGLEAVERVKLMSPDLILLDVMMPGMDGFQTCRLLKEGADTRDVPVIFMTALSDVEDKVKAFNAGGSDYVTKPFHLEEVWARINVQLQLRRAQNEVKSQHAHIEASEIRYRRLFETSKDGILLVNYDSGEITDANSSAISMLGVSRNELIRRRIWDTSPFQSMSSYRSIMAALESSAHVRFDDCSLEVSGRDALDIEFMGTMYEVEGSRILQCNIRDITDRKQAEARVHYMALHDALTGLPNRVLLQDRLSQIISMARRQNKRVAVLMLDLDRFKHINDSLGHHIGDRLLEQVSVRLKMCLRESDIVARLGGDEFVIALPTVNDKSDITAVASKILANLVEPFLIEGHQLEIGGSIGVAQYPLDGDTPQVLIQSADIAMYEAKGQGRGNYWFFTPELNEAAQRRLLLTHDLRRACERGQLSLHYQPQICPSSGNIMGVEALLRWQHPEHGSISPAIFIPLLEELGLIVEVGRWVLLTACQQNMAWQKKGVPSLRVAVNLSAQQFYRGDIVNTVKEILAKTGLEAKWLELELTESLTLDGSETTINIMRDLKALGISLSLDDFGTGWSSLSYLRRFPLDRIKIDRSFMRDLPSEPDAEAVVKSIMDLAHNLGLACVAEGVETTDQLAYLQKHLCSEVQGFVYSPALAPADCEQMLVGGNIHSRGLPGTISVDRARTAGAIAASVQSGLVH